jgi:hypothetical protein
MKKILLISALVFAGSAAAGHAQVLSTNVRANPQVTIPAKPKAAPPLTPSARGGVVPTAIRNGNPLQMLNPRAPARYGNSQEHVTQDPNDPGKPNGVKLFEWTF